MNLPIPHVELDATGLRCPLPILRAKKMLNGMASGEILCVRATDPSAIRDFHAFAKQTGNTLLFEQQLEGISVFFLRRK